MGEVEAFVVLAVLLPSRLIGALAGFLDWGDFFKPDGGGAGGKLAAAM